MQARYNYSLIIKPQLATYRLVEYPISELARPDISHTLCKLNFGPSRGQLKSCHFPEKREARRQCFYFLYECLGITDTTWAIILDNDLDLLLPFKRNKIRSRLG